MRSAAADQVQPRQVSGFTHILRGGELPCRSHYWIRRSTVRWIPRRPLDYIDVDGQPINTQPEPFSRTKGKRRWRSRLRRLRREIGCKVLRRERGHEADQ